MKKKINKFYVKEFVSYEIHVFISNSFLSGPSWCLNEFQFYRQLSLLCLAKKCLDRYLVRVRSFSINDKFRFFGMKLEYNGWKMIKPGFIKKLIRLIFIKKTLLLVTRFRFGRVCAYLKNNS